jgi:hypothetical protein
MYKNKCVMNQLYYIKFCVYIRITHSILDMHYIDELIFESQ